MYIAEVHLLGLQVFFLSGIGGDSLKESMCHMWKFVLDPHLAFSLTLTGKVKGKGRLRDFQDLIETVYGKYQNQDCVTPDPVIRSPPCTIHITTIKILT